MLFVGLYVLLQSIFVSRVTPEGAAERAGLRLGDKLLSVSAMA